MAKTWETFFDDFTLAKTVIIQRHFLNEILANTHEVSYLLEIGAGSGFTSLALHHSGRRVTASDTNPRVLDNIHQRMPCLRTAQYDMFDTGLSNLTVDCLYHQGLLEHFTDDEIVQALREHGRVANIVIFDVPNDRRWNKIQEFGNERFISVAHWLKLIKRSGLSVTKVTGRRLPKVFDLLPHFLQDVEFIKRNFGTTSIFVCEK